MIPISNIYYLLSYAWNKLEQSTDITIDEDDFDNANDLLVRLFISGVSYLCKRGLERTYNEHTEAIRGIKGKFLISDTIKQTLLPSGRAICAFDEYDYNTLPNQVIKYTLDRILRCEGLKKDHASQLKTLSFRFNQVNYTQISNAQISKIRLSKSNRHYKVVLDICKLILVQIAPCEQNDGQYLLSDFTRDDKKMAALFEAFLRNFYRQNTAWSSVKSEQILWNETNTTFSNVRLPTMKTDISMVSGEHKIIIDAKYYREALQSYYDKESIDSSNLYQLYAYLKNDKFQSSISTKGMLIYPTTNQELDEEYEIDGHPIKISTINLNLTWDAIHNRLLEVINVFVFP